MIEPSSCLVVFVSRKAIEPSDPISMVNLMLVLIELRCEWNSSACSLFMHTWLSSTYLIHHLGEFGADNRAIATLDENSLLAKHHMRYNHQIDLMNVEIVDRSSAWRQRLILEAWHSLRDTNAINEHIALPNVYNNIKNL